MGLFNFWKCKDAPKTDPDVSFGGSRKALVVGINNYPAPNTLRGCVNDAKAWWEALTKTYGYDVRVLLDERATKDNILVRLDWLFKGSKPGDSLVFCYSGHGTRFQVRNPNDQLDDGMDDAICPVDMNWDNGFILGQTIGDYITGMNKDASAWLLFDSCHSGHVYRDPEQTGGRFLEPPFDIAARSKNRDLIIKHIRDYVTDSGRRFACLAGCQDAQTCADAVINNVPCGAFSFFLAKSLTDPNTTPEVAMTNTTALLGQNGYNQVPQLTATSGLNSLPIFGGKK